MEAPHHSSIILWNYLWGRCGNLYRTFHDLGRRWIRRQHAHFRNDSKGFTHGWVHISPGSKQNHLRANKMSHLPDHKSLSADHHCVNQCLCYTKPWCLLIFLTFNPVRHEIVLTVHANFRESLVISRLSDYRAARHYSFLLCCCSHDNGLSSVALPTVS
jgi:hypothetical protein